MLWLPAPAGFEVAAWRTAALAALMAVWWATEAELRTLGPMSVPEKRVAAVGLAGWPPLAVTAVAASCAFMLPVGTAPNAIVYGSGRVRIRDMMRAGFVVDILGWGVIMAVASATLRWLA